MSAFGPKRLASAPRMSLLEVKQTWPIAPHTSAFDPKRTWHPRWNLLNLSLVVTAGGAACSDAVEADNR
jgi:hypothetical protein